MENNTNKNSIIDAIRQDIINTKPTHTLETSTISSPNSMSWLFLFFLLLLTFILLITSYNAYIYLTGGSNFIIDYFKLLFENENENENSQNIEESLKYEETLIKEEEKPIENDEYIADNSTSIVQSNKSGSKVGFCYIGEYNGIVSCAKVEESDECMSGKIFSSKENCINKNIKT